MSLSLSLAFFFGLEAKQLQGRQAYGMQPHTVPTEIAFLESTVTLACL